MRFLNKHRPLVLYTGGTLFVSLMATLLLWWWLRLDILLIWLFVISIITLATYGYDKAIAGSDRLRVPEATLLILTFVGGTIGALAGRYLFRHKTQKTSFRIKFWVVVGLQIILLAIYVYLVYLQR